MQILDIIRSALTVGGKNLNRNSDVVRSLNANSMSEYARTTRSEPICMVDHKIFNIPEMSDLTQSVTAIYAAMYMQAFSIAINQEIGDIKVFKTLEKINPNRSKLESILQASAALENYELKLPNFNEEQTTSLESVCLVISKEENGSVSSVWENVSGSERRHQEAVNAVRAHNADPNNRRKLREPERSSTKGGNVDTEAVTRFASNLSTGLLFSVTVNTAQGAKIEIPVSVRLLVNSLQTQNVLSLLSAAVKNQTAKERYREWRSGALSFWNDVILCKDITREYRKNLIKDETGMLNEILRRKQSNRTAGILSGNPSISQISNILIVSSDTIREFERDNYKKISDASVRDLIFRNTQVLMLIVVDQMRELVTFYYHAITLPTTSTFREIKAAGKSSNPDIMEYIKAFQLASGARI